jgi:hypothetical protein
MPGNGSGLADEHAPPPGADSRPDGTFAARQRTSPDVDVRDIYKVDQGRGHARGGGTRRVLVTVSGLAPAAAAAEAAETGDQRRCGCIRARRQAACDPAGPDHAGGAGICRLPRSRRARREPLRTGGQATAQRTSAEPTPGMPVGAATIGQPTMAKRLTPAPAANWPAEVRPVPAATLMMRDSFADVQVCRCNGAFWKGRK